MLNALHDLHLIFHLLIEDTILDELAFVKLLGGVRNAAERRGHLVDSSEGAPAYLPNTIITV